jgi:hypothetical protein
MVVSESGLSELFSFGIFEQEVFWQSPRMQGNSRDTVIFFQFKCSPGASHFTRRPASIFASEMTSLSYQRQRENLAYSTIETIRAISAALDREFLVSIQSMKVLAASTHLDKGQLIGVLHCRHSH